MYKPPILPPIIPDTTLAAKPFKTGLYAIPKSVLLSKVLIPILANPVPKSPRATPFPTSMLDVPKKELYLGGLSCCDVFC